MKRAKAILSCILIVFLSLRATTVFSAPAKKSKSIEHVVHYSSVDAKGAPIVLSGKVSVPLRNTPKGVMLMEHYTISSNAEAPSEKMTVDADYFCEEYILVMPDYLGWGVSKDSICPYLAGELTARNSVDMLLASMPVIDSIRPGTATDSIIIIGYSQGGAAALWTLMMIENEYADRIHVKACFAGSGPYDLASTYDISVKENKVGLAMTVPLLVLGTNAAYDLGLERSFFFTPELDKRYDKLIAPKEKGLTYIYMHMNNHRLSHWLRKECTDKTQAQTQRLYEGLMRSSLVHYPIDGTVLRQDTIYPTHVPIAPTYIFHSTQDKIVDFQNAVNLQRCWHDAPHVEFDFGRYGNHLRSMYIFRKHVRKKLEETQK